MDADTNHADLLRKLVEGLAIDSADGRAGLKAVLREIEAAAPGSVEMMAADLRMARLGAPALSTR